MQHCCIDFAALMMYYVLLHFFSIHIPFCLSQRVKYHLITYATPEYDERANQLTKSAIETGFDEVFVYKPGDLDSMFVGRNYDIFSQRRGAGFWSWKPYIILHYMTQRAKNGSIILYLDSNFVFSGVVDVKQILETWTEKPPHIGLVYTKSGGYFVTKEKAFTKRDSFHLMGVEESFETFGQNPNQVWSGFFAVKNEFIAIQFVSQWLTYAQDMRIISDSPSVILPEFNEFRENRHDQSICSLLARKWSIEIKTALPVGTFMGDISNTQDQINQVKEIPELYKTGFDENGNMRLVLLDFSSSVGLPPFIFGIFDENLIITTTEYCRSYQLSVDSCDLLISAAYRRQKLALRTILRERAIPFEVVVG